MRRIIIDSQSNRLLCGSALEQQYDQRGGLCQVGAGHLVLTRRAVDDAYLRYWRGLGFSLPEIVAVDEGGGADTLSDAVLQSPEALDAVARVARGGDARLEFFCIEEPEHRLARELGVPAYCSFDISLPLAGKIAFKQLCGELGLPTVPWVDGATGEAFLDKGRRMLAEGGQVLVKADRGMGGVGCGGMARVGTAGELERAVARLMALGMPLFLERVVHPLRKEFSIHWEMGFDGDLRRVAFFDTLAENSSYKGAAHPMRGSDAMMAEARRTLERVLAPWLAAHGARGFYCCDIVVDEKGRLYWNDFNPRKGASIYVHDMVERLSRHQCGGRPLAFWHEGLHLDAGDAPCLADILERLGGLAVPDESFVVLTNPGVVPYGRVDLTGVSVRSRESARDAFLLARGRLLS